MRSCGMPSSVRVAAESSGSGLKDRRIHAEIDVLDILHAPTPGAERRAPGEGTSVRSKRL